MDITFACTRCNEQYTVPERVAGKRVKCRVCGEVFVAPQPGEGELGLDLSALETLEPAPMSPPPIAAPARPAREPPAPAFSGGFFIDGPIPRPPAIPNKRRGRGTGPIDDLIHDKLPLLLIFVGIVLPTVLEFIQLIRSDPTFGSVCAFFLILGGYVFITIPLTVVGLRIAAYFLEFTLVESPGYRIVGAFAASGIAFVLYVLFHPPPARFQLGFGIDVAGIVTWLLTGLLISLLASFGLVKLFFFLRFGQAVATWFIASVSYVIGTLVTYALVVLVLWAGANIFGYVSASTARSDSAANDTNTPAPVPAAAPIVRDADKEKATRDQLVKIGQYLKQYFDANGKYPDALEALVTNGIMSSDMLHSPYGNGTGDDYAYAAYIVPGESASHDWVLVYDQSENTIEKGAMALRGTGEVDFMENNVLTFALSDGQKNAERLRDEKNAQTPPPPVAEATPPSIAPPPGPTTSPAPIEPPDTGPGWSAPIDAPLESAAINTHLRDVFNGADDLYFSQNGGAWLVVNPQPAPPTAGFRNPVNGELWNLRTLLRAGRFPAIHPMHDAILSPGGNYLVGRTLGGDPGVAVAFEVWSARSGKLLQTLATDAITGGATPRPIGFPSAGQVLTAGDQFDLWDLKTGARKLQFADQLTIDAKTLIAPSPNCHFVAVLAGDDSGVWLVSATTGKTLGEAKIDDAPVGTGDGRAIVFSPNGQEIAGLIGGQWIYVWSAASGKQLARFDIEKPVSGGADANPLVWMPDGQGWLAGGDRIIDREIGDCLFPLPPVVEQGGQEFGPRRVIDNGHIVAQFRTTAGDKTALEALSIDSSFVNTRAALRADRQAMKNAGQ